MRLGRIEVDDRVASVLIEGDSVVELEGDFFSGVKPTDRLHAAADVKWLPPVTPRLMFGPGPNFKSKEPESVEFRRGKRPERKAPYLTIKPLTGLIGTGEPIRPPANRIEHCWHEAECVAILGAPLRKATPGEAGRAILGYTCGNDFKDRGWFFADGSPWRAVGMESYRPIGPWIETEFDPRDSGAVARFMIDGEPARAYEVGTTASGRQEGSAPHETRLADMVHDFPSLFSFISQFVQLSPGDLIYSGAQTSGIAVGGVTGAVSIPGIGELVNPIVVGEPVEDDEPPPADFHPNPAFG
jgi:2-keto-4-pentenoate hydratase/2-oxohepta-3-ene-1,7-dioic acid hydratase in catechol pathway